MMTIVVLSTYGRLWPFKHDLREWAYRYIEPVYSFFAPKRVVFPMRGEPLPDEDSLVNRPEENLDSIFCQAGRSLHELMCHAYIIRCVSQ